jgi:hypothetical protein
VDSDSGTSVSRQQDGLTITMATSHKTKARQKTGDRREREAEVEIGGRGWRAVLSCLMHIRYQWPGPIVRYRGGYRGLGLLVVGRPNWRMEIGDPEIIDHWELGVRVVVVVVTVAITQHDI